MSTGKGFNQGKSTFLKQFLAENPDADRDAINRAWNAAGNGGTISESLLGKLRSRLGLTGRRRAPGGDEAGPEPEARPSPRAKARRKSGRASGPVGRGPSPDGEQPSTPAPGPVSSTSPSPGSPRGIEEDELDELEESIDELIQRIRDLGGPADVIKALKRARRLLIQGHGA